MGTRFLVVGGDAAGMSAASKAKRDDPDAEVVVFERGDWVSYGACGLPYYVEGTIDRLDELVVLGPEQVRERGIDLRRHSEVVAVDPGAASVEVEDDDGRYEESYDALLLATGGRGVLPDVPGSELDGVFAVRNLEAGRALRTYLHPHESGTDPSVETGYGSELQSYLAAGDPETAVVLGGNKIGLELAEAFHARGLDVHVVHAGPELLPVFGRDVGAFVRRRLEERGVHVHLDTDVERVHGTDGRVEAVETDGDPGHVPAEVVLADLGVEPNTDLAETAGIELGPTGAVARDEFGRTSAPDVYAAGDCAEKTDLLTDEPVHWPYALAANRAGRSIGRTVAGSPTSIPPIVETGTMKAFDLEVARTGLLDAAAREAGFDSVSTTITTITRAHYYPGWSRIVVHAVADASTDRVLGASMVGAEGAAHRINSVATAIHAGMTVDELGDLDFGYSPPFGPVWDPVLTAAKSLAGDLAGEGADAGGRE